MNDQELELHIKHCGDLMQQEYDAGNTEAATSWMQAMHEAIKSRSPAQVAKMEAALGLEPCYFATMGDKHRAELLKRQAA